MSYKEKIERKKERFNQLANKAEIESNNRFSNARTLTDMIPMGQPILVGHHSEKGHRAHLKKIDNNMRKGVEASQKASYYANKAASVGTGGISSDDPEAIKLLQEKLNKLEKEKDYMKKINKAFKKGTLKEEGFTEEQIHELEDKIKKAYSWEKQPFPGYLFTNIGATIRATKKRITDLQVLRNNDSTDIEHKNFSFTENKDENRYIFKFPGKPDEETRTIIKRHGFKWSRYAMAWVRKVTLNARFSKDNLIKELSEREITISTTGGKENE